MRLLDPHSCLNGLARTEPSVTAILFGSISTLADTSELQRKAFNQAFEQHGLSWRWEQDEYRTLLGSAGGRDRVAEYASAHGEEVDADAVHATKSKIFQETVGTAGLSPRPGVVEMIGAAKDAGVRLGLVTTTSPDNVQALLAALADSIPLGTFDVVVDWDAVAERKPAPDAYRLAVSRLDETPATCVALEDNPAGVQSATSAGVRCIAFPNENTGDLDFSGAERRVTALDYSDVTQTTPTDRG